MSPPMAPPTFQQDIHRTSIINIPKADIRSFPLKSPDQTQVSLPIAKLCYSLSLTLYWARAYSI